MKLNFKRKKYLITGASSGLGRELSYFLDKHGADLTIIGSNKKELSKTFKKLSKNKKHHKIIADFSNINKSKIIIKKIFHGHKYNGFINCAGVHTFSSINNLTDDQIIKSFNINSVYPYLILKNFSKLDNYHSNASVVLIGSISSITGSTYLSLYASSKISQVTLSKSLSSEFAKKKLELIVFLLACSSLKFLKILKKSYQKNLFLELKKNIL